MPGARNDLDVWSLFRSADAKQTLAVRASECARDSELVSEVIIGVRALEHRLEQPAETFDGPDQAEVIGKVVHLEACFGGRRAPLRAQGMACGHASEVDDIEQRLEVAVERLLDLRHANPRQPTPGRFRSPSFFAQGVHRIALGHRLRGAAAAAFGHHGARSDPVPAALARVKRIICSATRGACH